MKMNHPITCTWIITLLPALYLIDIHHGTVQRSSIKLNPSASMLSLLYKHYEPCCKLQAGKYVFYEKLIISLLKIDDLRHWGHPLEILI
mmetsp:Transcript_948/g.1331  ORF Transcript_948/g.1331 Transcript_948/m.1331 type:complete len:89 (-) Transcript_948:1127-1393(-)